MHGSPGLPTCRAPTPPGSAPLLGGATEAESEDPPLRASLFGASKEPLVDEQRTVAFPPHDAAQMLHQVLRLVTL